MVASSRFPAQEVDDDFGIRRTDRIAADNSILGQ
jgi:hypothetical protein